MKAFMLLALIALPVAAQWVNYPTPGIPRGADGKPNFSAPAPRAADGKPDMSGVWEKISKYEKDITVDLGPKDVKPWAAELTNKRVEDLGKDHMIPRCLPLGPGYVTNGGSTGAGITKIVQTPTLIIFLSQDMTYRQIFMDGRKLESDPNPSWMGYSVGHWEGDTLVVETNGYNDQTWLDRNGHPHSEKLRTTERYRRTALGKLEFSMTLEDPEVYAKPWTVSMEARLAADTDLIEYVCLENAQKALTHWVGKASDEEKNAAQVPASTLAKYAGTYKSFDVWNNEPAPRFIEVSVVDGVLYGQLRGQAKQRLIPQSQTTFSGFYGLGLKFLLDAKGEVEFASEMHVSGDYRFSRLPK